MLHNKYHTTRKKRITFKQLNNKFMYIIILYTLGPITMLLYKVLEYYKFWDCITNRKYAISGLERLKNGSAYPISWIFNDENNKKEFNALFNRIKKNTQAENIKSLLIDGFKPDLLATAGMPIIIGGINPEWKQEYKAFYSSNHPILMTFKVNICGETIIKGDRCCSIGELEKWIDNEKKKWDFWLGVVVMTIFSIASIIWRLQIL